MVALDPVLGSEQAKTRPCVVMQRDVANRAGRTTIVIPVTDAKDKSVTVITPLLRAGDGGLAKDSVGLCLQVRAVDRQRMRKKIGFLTAASVDALSRGLIEILDLEKNS